MQEEKSTDLPNKGQLLVDATACPQDISYPTDLNLLNDAREKAEELIDVWYSRSEFENNHETIRS